MSAAVDRSRQEAGLYAQVVRAPAAEMARYLQGLLGQKLTALVTGTRDPKAVGCWARGERTPHPKALKALRDAYYAARLLEQGESRETVQAWFMGMNPLLDDTAPALAIKKEPARVLQAARALVASA